MCAGFAALLGISATASAAMRETIVLYVMGGTDGHLYQDCNTWQTIYAFGEVYDYGVGRNICEARSERYGRWGWSNGDCSQGDWQRGSLRTAARLFYSGQWVAPITNTSFPYGNIYSRDEGSSTCATRQFLAYAFATDQQW